MAELYVGTYKKYNEGSLFGEWMDLEDYADAEDFFEACRELHKDEKEPEFMFQDYQDFPEKFYSESMGAKEIQDIIDFLEKFDEDERNAIEEYWDEIDGSADAKKIRDAIAKKDGTSGADFAEESAEEMCREIPEWLVGRVDWHGVWRDMEQDGYAETTNYIFYPI